MARTTGHGCTVSLAGSGRHDTSDIIITDSDAAQDRERGRTIVDAACAVDRGERAMRLSPRDTMNCIPQGIIGFGNFLLGRHDEAIEAGRLAIQLNPGFSILHGVLAMPLVMFGRLDEAKADAARLRTRAPGVAVGRRSAAVGIASGIANRATDVLQPAGLPGRTAPRHGVTAARSPAASILRGEALSGISAAASQKRRHPHQTSAYTVHDRCAWTTLTRDGPSTWTSDRRGYTAHVK